MLDFVSALISFVKNAADLEMLKNSYCQLNFHNQFSARDGICCPCRRKNHPPVFVQFLKHLLMPIMFYFLLIFSPTVCANLEEVECTEKLLRESTRRIEEEMRKPKTTPQNESLTKFGFEVDVYSKVQQSCF